MPRPLRLDALGVSGAFRSGNAQPVTGIDDAVLGELSIAPPLLVKRNMAALRRARPLPVEDRLAALAAAGELFLGTVDGIPLREHERTVALASGVALPVVREASQIIARAAAVAGESVAQARPLGTADDWRSVRTAGAVWVPRGEVLAVQAPANHPAVHTVWLEALALGYRVAVRPSGREPFTPHRLVGALQAAGFGRGQVVLLPTHHAAADVLVEAADLSVVYGGDAVAAAYAKRSDVLVQGPGRSKVLLADGHWEDHLETVVQSVAGYGATACVNASTVFVDGDARGLAKELARHLSAIPIHSPLSEDAVLPAFSVARAKALEAYLWNKLDGAELVSGDDLAVKLPCGGAVLRPAVVLLGSATAPQIRTELPFPCVWVAPWSPGDGIAPLRDTLTLTAFTEDEKLLSLLLHEPSISNVHIGDHPTYLMRPGLPHDGHFAEFLMKSKTVIREPAT